MKNNQFLIDGRCMEEESAVNVIKAREKRSNYDERGECEWVWL
jgi:flagellar biosynthesis/type III secretory pathway chaperone